MVKAAPIVRTLAKELGVDINTLTASADNGYVSKDEVRAAVRSGVPAAPPAYVVPASPIDTINPEAVHNIPVAPPEPAINHRARDEGEARAPLNHKKDDSVEVDGLRFKRPDRGNLDHSVSKRLDINKEYLNNDLDYRWVTDDGGRIEQLRERLGYASVPNIKTEDGDTITTRRLTGTNKDGTPQYQQLMATPKNFREERMAKAEENRVTKERGIVDAPTDEHGKALSTEEYYMPEGAKIERK